MKRQHDKGLLGIGVIWLLRPLGLDALGRGGAGIYVSSMACRSWIVGDLGVCSLGSQHYCTTICKNYDIVELIYSFDCIYPDISAPRCHSQGMRLAVPP